MDTDQILIEKFINDHPQPAARTIERLEDEAVAALLQEIPTELAVRLLSLMNVYKVAASLKLIDRDLAITLLENSALPKVELWLRQMEEHHRNHLLDQISPKIVTILRPKLAFPAQSVGGVMIPTGFALHKEMTVKEALQIMKRTKDQIASTIGVVNADGLLEGTVSLHDLALARGSDLIAAVMKTDTPKFFGDLPVESINDHPGWYEYQALPVVDNTGKLIGILHREAAQNLKLAADHDLTKQVMETSTALGELYRIGLTAFLQSVSK